MNQPRYWSPGDQIVYREVWRGKVWTARPVTVVQDAPDLVVLYLCSGTRWKLPAGNRDEYRDALLTGEWQLRDVTYMWGDTLFLIRPGEAHAVHVMWRHETREFSGWYINLQEPLRRTAIGFDFMDQELDIVVKPDLSGWVWKDEEEFQKDVETGLTTPGQAREIRAEAGLVLERVRAKASPFSDGWETWHPPAGWPIPSLPVGWDKV
jgi:predicted RNA-binding protein associated with RNAse of E/G family